MCLLHRSHRRFFRRSKKGKRGGGEIKQKCWRTPLSLQVDEVNGERVGRLKVAYMAAQEGNGHKLARYVTSCMYLGIEVWAVSSC